MKYIFLPIILLFLTASFSFGQAGKTVTGIVTDTLKVTQPGSVVQIKTEAGDSSSTTTNMDGRYTFNNVKGLKATIYISSLGFQNTIKHFTLTTDAKIELPPIAIKEQKNELKEVTIVGVNPIKFSEDTIDYKVAAYKVRENAPVEDVLKKVPGVDVDANGNVTAQGQTVTKVRINGKDFMGGDVQSATKNLPADILESIQVIDDYGDQANLTGVKTGTPNKILNFTIRADKNYGYSLNITGGAGEDMLPAADGADAGRYLGLINLFDFKADRQLTVLGNLNNTNVNTFNFTGGGGGGGGGLGGNGGNGGGRGNAARGAAANTGLATVANGITNARSLGTNYRDQWGKTLSVYGSYSFADNTTYTASQTLQQNFTSVPTTSSTSSTEHDNPINHRFTFNMEWRPDTTNYLKVTPTFSYATTNTSESESDQSGVTNSNTITSKYTSTTLSNSQTPTIGLTMLYNHRFHNRNNLSIYLNSSTSTGNTYENITNNYSIGIHNAPADQVVNQNNTTTTASGNFDYLQHLGKTNYLDFNYTYSYSYTLNDKETDTVSTAGTLNNYSLLSNNFNYTFITNKIGLNYRVIEPKYNYTIGISALPAILDGQSVTTGVHTHKDEFNIVPNARYVYQFSRNQSFTFNYNGSASQPTFTQLQPVYDFSSALYPVVGNPDLKPQFTNSVQIRYQNFGLTTGNVFFMNLQYSETNNDVVSQTTSYRTLSTTVLASDPTGTLKRLQNTTLTQYTNADGFYNASANLTYSKPWNERRYTLTFTGNASYANNISYTDSVNVNNVHEGLQENISKTLTLTPGSRFRVDITDVIDAQALVNYSITRVSNSVQSAVTNLNDNTRQLTFQLTGKQYILKDWTFSYDYTKLLNYGFAASEDVKNPNVLNTYLERRFLKNKQATIRFSVFDLFNQNAGYTTTVSPTSFTQQNVNRLGRYYLATFTLRLQKFAGRAPTQNNQRGDRPPGPPGAPGGGGGRNGGFGGGGGGRGPGGPSTASF